MGRSGYTGSPVPPSSCQVKSSAETMGKEGWLPRKDKTVNRTMICSLHLFQQPPQSLPSTCLVDPWPSQSLSPEQRGQLWQSQPAEEDIITRNCGMHRTSLPWRSEPALAISPSHCRFHTEFWGFSRAREREVCRHHPLGPLGMPSCGGQLTSASLWSSLGPLHKSGYQDFCRFRGPGVRMDSSLDSGLVV